MTDLSALSVEELVEKAEPWMQMDRKLEAVVSELALRAACATEMEDFADLRSMRADVAESRSIAKFAVEQAARYRVALERAANEIGDARRSYLAKRYEEGDELLRVSERVARAALNAEAVAKV